MTTRKVLAAAAAALALAGCATPGPLQVYAIDGPASDAITAGLGPTPSFLQPGESLTGFAYDPFTDHFFLRLAPGNRIRVVDRPARAIKREFSVRPLPADGGGDLAIRPRDGHVFLLHPAAARVTEITRLGAVVRPIELAGAAAAPRGLAYDATQDELLVATERTVTRYRLSGEPGASVTLARAIGGSLGFDGVAREFYAPLADGSALGVFGEDGALHRTLPLPVRFVDVGPHSFLRVF